MCLSCLFSDKAIAIGLFLLIFISSLFQKINPLSFSQPTPTLAPTPIASPSAQLTGEVKVIRVIDGDTIEIETGKKVRYIGIDAPELGGKRKPVECFAREAFEKNKQLVEGKTVRLEKDVSQTDKYGRLLRYVFVDDLFVNQYLVAQGYAFASTFPPDVKYSQLFKEAQRQAQEKNLGLWQKCQKL